MRTAHVTRSIPARPEEVFDQLADHRLRAAIEARLPDRQGQCALRARGRAIRLSEEGGGTRVEWTSIYRVPTPIVDGLQERLWEIALARGFRRALEDVERIR